MEKITLEFEPRELLLLAEGLSHLPIRAASRLLSKVEAEIIKLQEKEKTKNEK